MGMSELYCSQCKRSEYVERFQGKRLMCYRHHHLMDVSALVNNCSEFAPERKEDSPTKPEKAWRYDLKRCGFNPKNPYDPVFDQPFGK